MMAQGKGTGIVTSIHPDGNQSTRDLILYTLKITNQAKVDDLAEAVNVSPVTVRHHLNALKADRLIKMESVRRKVGRPYYIYSLSETGHELFPRKYVRFTNRLLEELKNNLPPDTVTTVFDGIARKIIAEHKGKFEHLPFDERLTYLTNTLREEGFIVEWEHDEDQYTLVEYGCPYYSVGDQHIEICGLDKDLMISILQTPVEQTKCILHGDEICQFTFSSQTDEIE